MPAGRPSSFTQEIADLICTRLELGESLRNICASEEMPDRSTVLRWLTHVDGFSDQYTRARDLGLDAVAEEVIAIADDGSADWVTRYRENGSEYQAVDQEHIQRSKLRFDARRWYLSKLAPKKYGDSTLLRHSDPDGNPLQVTVSRVDSK